MGRIDCKDKSKILKNETGQQNMEMKKFASDITVLICKDFGSAHSF